MKRVAYLFKDSDVGPSPGVLRPTDWNQVTFNGVTGWEPVPTIFERQATGADLGTFNPADGYTSQVDEIRVVDGPEFIFNATDGCVGGTTMPRAGR